MNVEKEAIRKRLQTGRSKLSESEVAERTSLILERLIHTIDWGATNTIFTYLPNPKQHEINTWPFLEYVWKEHPNITTYAPVMSGDSMHMRAITHTATLTTSSFGIPEPLGHTSLEVAPDVCIVPVTGFTTTGYRLGYGKGHYDRFLTRYENMISIGLAYDDSQTRFPIEAHDMSLSHIVTESRILHTVL